MASGGQSAVRTRRQECGLSQAQLAQRAGVSRQLVAAVEAGLNTPAVDAAIRIAHALGSTVEQLFVDSGRRVMAALGGELPADVPLRVGRVGERLVAAELPDHGTTAAGWAAADGVLHEGELRLFPGAAIDGLVLAGCDPALSIVEALLAGLGPRSVIALSAPTDTALRSLGDGLLHAAAVHGPAGTLPPVPLAVARIHLASWPVGLAVSPALGSRGLVDVLERGAPVVQRAGAAASQQALLRAVEQHGHEPPRGPRASGHIDAARQAAILGCAAVTTQSAAHAFGLQFDALEQHTVEIWIAEEWVNHPAVQPLGNLLASSALRARLGVLGGYDLDRAGTLI